MKKFIAVGIMIFCVLITGCSRSKTFLSMEFQPGAAYRYTVSTTQDLAQSMMGETLEMTQTLTWVYVFQIMDVDDNSVATINIIFDEIGLESQGPFGQMVYRSWEHEGEVPQSVRAFTTLLDKHVTMKVSSEGRVMSITGTDTIINDMIAALGLDSDTTMIESARRDLENQFGSKAMIENMGKIFPVYPLQSVGAGDAWGAEMRLSKGLPVIVHSTWHISDLQNGMMTLDAYGIIAPNSDVLFMNVPGARMHYKLHGHKRGRYTIDSKTGWIITGEIQQYTEGVAVITGLINGQAQSAQWPLHVTEKIQIETRELGSMDEEDSTTE